MTELPAWAAPLTADEWNPADYDADLSSAAPEGETEDVPSWAPIDPSSVLDGTHTVPQPTYVLREDGVCLGYPGAVHAFIGEPESMKSMLAQAEAARSVNEGIACSTSTSSPTSAR